MTNIYVSYKTVAVAAIVAFGTLAFSSLSATASTTNDLRNCHANSKQRFVKCCDTVIREQGKPLWYVETGSSCQSIVVCKKYPLSFVAAYPFPCNFQMPSDDNQGSNPGNGRKRGNTFYGKD